jgi:hypothetical protein
MPYHSRHRFSAVGQEHFLLLKLEGFSLPHRLFFFITHACFSRFSTDFIIGETIESMRPMKEMPGVEEELN